MTMFKGEKQIRSQESLRITSYAPQECVGFIVLAETIIPRAVIDRNVLLHFPRAITPRTIIPRERIILKVYYSTYMEYRSVLFQFSQTIAGSSLGIAFVEICDSLRNLTISFII